MPIRSPALHGKCLSLTSAEDSLKNMMVAAGKKTDAWESLALLQHRGAWPLWAVHGEFRESAGFPKLQAWNARLDDCLHRNEMGLPIRFVPHVARRRGAPWQRDSLYDGQIFLRGEVPSREDQWHDYFNMCVWSTFPKAKAALNAEQWRALCRWLPAPAGLKLPGARLREQDALALTDEGGVLLLVEHANAERAAEFAAAGDLRGLTQLVSHSEGLAIPFGHALYEHLMTGQGEVRGALVVLSVPQLPSGRNDALLLADDALATRLRSGVLAFRGAPGVSMQLAESGVPPFA